MGIEVPEQERLDMVSGKIPSQAFYSAFGDPRTGAYNAAAVSQFLSQAASDARAQQAWNDLNEQARLERAVQKYATLIGKGAYVNKLEIEDGVDAANQVFGGKYVAKRYSSVPDSLVSVSSGEIKSFYNAHKEMFKQSPSRTLSYVVFEVNATDDDMLNLEKEVRAVGEKFDAAEDVKLFVRQDRHGEIADRYVTAAQLGEQAEALVAGKMFGPELKNNVWTMARVVESRMAPDTLGLKMIVLPYTAEKLADSLKTVATSENFADLSRQYSANEKGRRGEGDERRRHPARQCLPCRQTLETLQGGDGKLSRGGFGRNAARRSQSGQHLRRERQRFRRRVQRGRLEGCRDAAHSDAQHG